MRALGRLLCLTFGIALTGVGHHAAAESKTDSCVVGVQATTTVASATALQLALSEAEPGTTIVIEEGDYKGDFSLSKSGHAAKPITIRAGGKVKFKDTLFALKGDYAVLTGMIFDNGMVAVLGNYNRVTRNVFKNGKRAGNRSKLRSAIHTEGAAKYNRFDHNDYLHDLLGQWGNTGEALQVGTGPGAVIFEPGTIIEYNLIDGHKLESEILSLKASNNIVRGNTFVNAPKGSVTTRTSSNNLLMNHTFINIKSLSIYADNNKVIGNKFINSNLNIKSGDAIFPELLENNSKYQSAHPAARKSLVVGNQFSDGKIRLEGV